MDSSEYHKRIELGFENLKNEMFGFIDHEKSEQATIQMLQSDLKAYKRALESTESECDKLRKLQEETCKENDALREQVRVTANRVIALIDGDGCIFSGDLISQGQDGGGRAARSLSEAIASFLRKNCSATPYQLWVYLFFNKRGLMDTFSRVGQGLLNRTFEDFVMGFNQANDRFSMVDVGNMKEAADAKLKAHLEDDTCLPQTFKIIFGGCHDNGYLHSLRSQMTVGHRDKLILLKGYEQMPAAIEGLGLPLLQIPDLFITRKLAPPSPIQTSDTLDKSPSEEGDSPAPSYSRVLQRAAGPNWRERNGRECSPPSEATWESSYALSGKTGTKHVIPHLPLSKQNPPPCTLFYLSYCNHEAKCKYGHDYLLNDEQLEQLRQNARLGPCPDINRGEICTWGEACIYGHVCPKGANCFHYRLGKCWFKGADMHRVGGDPALV
ncbi:hypothetical protein FB45DRAFT_903527 [Roridomyces roridus]|uniref:C3H1-type domain-containing protein n=1 Tax=Roridomyces roridus TaxID=1738132 RepID=A0AAD7C429_9AGAR|nr:hypothetical protein FB45DRAFT_903527 [Roridomyces roridus]